MTLMLLVESVSWRGRGEGRGLVTNFFEKGAEKNKLGNHCFRIIITSNQINFFNPIFLLHIPRN